MKAKSLFQVGGAGAVGTGSLRGMRELHHLRAAGFHVWPFDPPAMPLLVEIYPRTYTRGLVVSSASARQRYAAEHWDALDPRVRNAVLDSDDAFDATITALAMEAYRDELLALPHVTHPQLRLEGAIWHPGWTEAALVPSPPGPTRTYARPSWPPGPRRGTRRPGRSAAILYCRMPRAILAVLAAALVFTT